uniref:Uncharacterized protein n=1 Tax=Arundo donax TaxID=35708 RepID=A0A0A9ANW1_ARUDO
MSLTDRSGAEYFIFHFLGSFFSHCFLCIPHCYPCRQTSGQSIIGKSV